MRVLQRGGSTHEERWLVGNGAAAAASFWGWEGVQPLCSWLWECVAVWHPDSLAAESTLSWHMHSAAAEPREAGGLYWGYTTRLAHNLQDMLETCPFPGMDAEGLGSRQRRREREKKDCGCLWRCRE